MCRDQNEELAICSSSPSAVGFLARAGDLYPEAERAGAQSSQTPPGSIQNLVQLAVSSIWSLLWVPLCSVTLSSLFLSASWLLSLCVHVMFPFLFVWTQPSCHYYHINKEYSLVGANEYFVIHENRLGHKKQRAGTPLMRRFPGIIWIWNPLENSDFSCFHNDLWEEGRSGIAKTTDDEKDYQ